MSSIAFDSDAFPDRETYHQILLDSYSWRYNNGKDTWSNDLGMTAATSIYMEHLPVGKLRILDIGAGSGRDVFALASIGHEVVGVDIMGHPAWPQILQEFPDTVSLIKTSFLDWPIENKNFHGVLDNGCFHHQHPNEWKTYLERMSAVTAPGGLIGINVFGYKPGGIESGWHEMDNNRKGFFFTTSSLHELLAIANMKLLHIQTIPLPERKWDYIMLLARR